MQLELFKVKATFKDGSELYECRTCKRHLPISMYQVREDRSGYRAKDCKDCARKESKAVEQLRKIAPPKPDKCDCCGKQMEEHEFYLDHCHETKEFRGWLCNTCNSGIGILGDTIEHLEQALRYLRKAYDK